MSQDSLQEKEEQRRGRFMTIGEGSQPKHYNVGVQSICAPRHYIPVGIASEHELSHIDFPKIFYVPHTILFPLCTLALLCFFFFQYEHLDTHSNIQLGICMAGITIMLFAAVHMPDCLLTRPNPIFWRMLQGVALVYLVFAVFILFQNLDDARTFLRYFDRRLGVPLEEFDYATDCRLYTPENPESSFYNMKEILFDSFILSHAVGWMLQMVIIRDIKLCMFLQIFFESLELTFKTWIPSFDECWWDSLILDVILCNTGGIILGNYVVKYLSMKQYNWVLSEYKKTKEGGRAKLGAKCATNIGNIFRVFRPNVYSKFKWRAFTSTKNFLALILYICFLEIIVLSYFFMKLILWIPPTHWTLCLRLWMWFFLTIPGTKDYYHFAFDKHFERVGSALWII